MSTPMAPPDPAPPPAPPHQPVAPPGTTTTVIVPAKPSSSAQPSSNPPASNPITNTQTPTSTAPPSSSSSLSQVPSTVTAIATNTVSTSSLANNGPLPTSSVATFVQPQIVTKTSIATRTPFSTSTPPTQDAASGSTPFFKNKGAVAAVFSVVGLLGVAILVALITNAIRRRRAEKFDRDVAEAAAEAARATVFLDDDPFHDRRGYGGGYGGGYDDEYSGGSHGAYAQPPLTHHNLGAGDTYPMSEMAGEGYGAAGVGTLGRNKSLVQQHQTSRSRDLVSDAHGRNPSQGGPYSDFTGGEPYAAFAMPQVGSGAQGQGHVRGLSYRSGEGDLIGMGDVAIGTAIGSGPGSTTDPTTYSSRGQPVRSSYSPTLSRNRSLAAPNQGEVMYANGGGGESYAAHYASGRVSGDGNGMLNPYSPGTGEGSLMPNPHSPGVGMMMNPYSPGLKPEVEVESEEEEEEGDPYAGTYSAGGGESVEEPTQRRVLKVANQ